MPTSSQPTFQHVSVSAAQPPVDGLISSSLFIKRTRQGSPAPVAQFTGARLMSAASGPVSQPSTQTPGS